MKALIVDSEGRSREALEAAVTRCGHVPVLVRGSGAIEEACRASNFIYIIVEATFGAAIQICLQVRRSPGQRDAFLIVVLADEPERASRRLDDLRDLLGAGASDVVYAPVRAEVLEAHLVIAEHRRLIVRDMKAFSGSDDDEPTTGDLREVIDSAPSPTRPAPLLARGRGRI